MGSAGTSPPTEMDLPWAARPPLPQYTAYGGQNCPSLKRSEGRSDGAAALIRAIEVDAGIPASGSRSDPDRHRCCLVAGIGIAAALTGDATNPPETQSRAKSPNFPVVEGGGRRRHVEGGFPFFPRQRNPATHATGGPCDESPPPPGDAPPSPRFGRRRRGVFIAPPGNVAKKRGEGGRASLDCVAMGRRLSLQAPQGPRVSGRGWIVPLVEEGKPSLPWRRRNPLRRGNPATLARDWASEGIALSTG